MRRGPWAVVATAWLASGCANWRQVPVAPAALAAEPTEIRITRSSGVRVVMTMPRIEGDSIRGDIDGKPEAFAVADVKRLALPSASDSQQKAGTVVVVTTLATAVLGWVVLITANNSQ